MPENNNPFHTEDLPRKNDENFELPKINETPTNNATITPEKKNIIEIPQEYYDKLAEEERIRQEKAAAEEQNRQERQEAKTAFDKFFFLAIINAIVIFAFLYLAINKNSLFIFGIPVILILLTIFYGIKNKKESSYPIAILVGGIIVAVITFIISMLKEEEVDVWTYYSIASVAIGFLGMITSNIINKIITSLKELKALQMIGYILYFVALIAIPLYLEKNYHEEFHKYVFLEQVEVQAETEEEFIVKTLKARYNEEFICDNTAINYQVDEANRKQNERKCKDIKGNEIVVVSKTYNELKNQYIITENYIDKLFLIDNKTKIIEELQIATATTSVELSLYPEKNCTFYGDCADCDEYYDRYAEETSLDKQYKQSVALNFEKSLTLDAKTFINTNKFKYIINLTGTFSETGTDYTALINKALNRLNELGYKNTFGYIITVSSYSTSQFGNTNKLVFKVVGDTNAEQSFKDPKVVSINANKTSE